MHHATSDSCNCSTCLCLPLPVSFDTFCSRILLCFSCLACYPLRQLRDFDYLWTGCTDLAVKHGLSGEPAKMVRTAREPGMPPRLLLDSIG